MTKVIIGLVIWCLVGYSSIFVAAKVKPWPVTRMTVVLFTIFGPFSYLQIGLVSLTNIDSCVLNCKGEK